MLTAGNRFCVEIRQMHFVPTRLLRVTVGKAERGSPRLPTTRPLSVCFMMKCMLDSIEVHARLYVRIQFVTSDGVAERVSEPWLDQ